MPQLIVQVCNDRDGKGHYLKKYTPTGLFSFDLSPFLPFLSIVQEESVPSSGAFQRGFRNQDFKIVGRA